MERSGEKVAKDCPTYVVSQFLAKVKPEIAQQLVLKAEEFTTLVTTLLQDRFHK